MGFFRDTDSNHEAYEEGVRDGQETRRTGRFTNPGRRPLERPDEEAGAYTRGHIDGQDSG